MHDSIDSSAGAACSYALVLRAGDAFKRHARLTDLMALFSLIETTVLYRNVYYLPFGDYSNAVTESEWGVMLSDAGLIRLSDELVSEVESPTAQAAFKSWSGVVRAIGPVPANQHFDEAATLEAAFRHGLRARVDILHGVGEVLGESDKLLSAEGLDEFVQNVAGKGANPDAQFLDWESMATVLARSAVADKLGLDYVGDPFEQPVVLLTDRMSSRSLATRLYQKLSGQFSNRVAELRDAGVPISISVPPIATLVLDRSDGTSASVLQETLALREEFATFRNKYAQYMETFQKPHGRTLEELSNVQREAIAEVGNALDKVKAERTDSRLISEILGAELKPGDGHGPALAIEPSVSIAGLIRLGLGQRRALRIRGRAKSLFDVWSKAMKVRDYHSLVGRRLGVQIKEQERSGYEAYGNRLRELVSSSGER